MALLTVTAQCTEIDEVKTFLAEVEDILCSAAMASKGQDKELLKRLDIAYCKLLEDITKRR